MPNRSYTNFDIEIPADVKKILLSFSGGTESVLSLYTISEYIKHFNLDIKVSVIHGLDTKDCPESLHNVDIMLEKIGKIFNTTFDLHTFQYEGVEKKSEIHNKNIEKTIEEYGYDMVIFGSSANPPIEVMKEIYPKKDPTTIRCNRNPDIRKTENRLKLKKVNGKKFYKFWPVLWLHKKQIAEAFKQYDDLLEIQKLTRSCDRTVNGVPCKKCYACAEKKWGFGFYDGGL